MKQHSVFANSRGFTLIEVAVATVLVAVVVVGGLAAVRVASQQGAEGARKMQASQTVSEHIERLHNEVDIDGIPPSGFEDFGDAFDNSEFSSTGTMTPSADSETYTNSNGDLVPIGETVTFTVTWDEPE